MITDWAAGKIFPAPIFFRIGNRRPASVGISYSSGNIALLLIYLEMKGFFDPPGVAIAYIILMLSALGDRIRF